MKNRRDLLLVIGLFAALILFVAFGPRPLPASDPNVPTTHSTADGGAQVLYSWVSALGYRAARLEYQEFAIDEETAALLVLNPSEQFTRAHATATLDWVERGGTLIFADDSSLVFGGARPLFDELSVDREVYSDTAVIEEAQPAQPALEQPPFARADVNAGRVLVPQRSDVVSLLGNDTASVLAGIKHGRGYIYLSSTIYPFTNQGLRNPDNAALVLNLLRTVPTGGRVLFDEYHHGYFTPPSASRTVFSSPWGWAGLYAVLAIGLYLVLSGRRFGRAVPTRAELARRSSAEYVESMADLFQRAGKREYILRHYHSTFKRSLARPAGINPRLEDPVFVAELARFREVDQPALLALLARLRDARADEAALVRAVGEADALLEAYGIKRKI